MSTNYSNQTPSIPKSVFVAPGAQVIGAATIGENASIWYNVTIRADIARIKIGNNTNIQDGSVIHVDEDVPTVIGNHVSVGHNVIVHSSTVADHVLLGMGSILLSGSKIGKGAMIAAGALVKENFEVPPNSLVVGIPGKVVRELRDDEREENLRNAKHYVELGASYLKREQS